MNKLKQDYNNLINSKEFDNKDYFCGAFLMAEIKDLDTSDISWQLDFYNEKSDKIISYSVNEKINKSGDTEIFKKEKIKIEKLNIDDVKIDFDEAIKISKKSLKKHNEIALKIIAILQNIKRPTWKISYITQNFNLINLKIDAINGKILDDKIVSLLSWGKIEDSK